ncbi:MAG: hypothetical protein NUK62_00540 [Tenericutes bacterium]|nr:hypothetical protein [Mycoplasmatota bacterium]
MKKIWFTVLIFLGLVALAGCQDATPDVELHSFEVEVVDIEGTVLLSETISYEEGTDRNIVYIIDEAIGLDYDVYEIGVFVNGIGEHYPTEYNITYNYYFGLFINDVPITSGIENVVLTDEIKVSFKEVSLLDEVDLKVDELIQQFITNHLDTYINDEQIHHYVALAIAQLNARNYLVPQLDSLVSNVNSIQRDTIANTFKTSIYETLFDHSIEDTRLTLESFEADNHYDAMSLLNGLYLTKSDSDLIESLVLQLMSLPMYMDADYAGMVISSLAPYSGDVDVQLFIDDMLTYIQDNQTSEGIDGWGGPNSASTASVVIGLVAQGINPRDEAYTVDGIDLIDALLGFELNGAYKLHTTSEEADMAFSTPQAFTALVAYKLYRDVYGNPPVNIFNLG